MMIEFVPLDRAGELDQYVTNHPRGHYMQTSLWGKARTDWCWRGMILRGKNKEILATVALMFKTSALTGRKLFYAPRGPVFSDIEHYQELTAFLIRYARDQGGYLLRIDPAVSVRDQGFRKVAENMGFRIDTRADFTTFQPKNVYQVMLSGLKEEELLARFHRKTRYNIHLAQKRGVTVREVGAAYLPVFQKMMAETARRNNFHARPEDFFRRILESAPDNVFLLLAEREGKFLAGAIEIIQGRRAWYAYGCSFDQGRKDMPNVLIQWEMIRRAMAAGCSVYDMRGVEGETCEHDPGNGLHRFKQGFDGRLVEYAGQMDLVLRPVAYRLIRIWKWLCTRLRMRSGSR